MTNRPSAVWAYFTKQSDFMVCKVCPEGSARAKLSGTLASNAKKHLSFCHKNEHEDVEFRDAQRPQQQYARRRDPTGTRLGQIGS